MTIRTTKKFIAGLKINIEKIEQDVADSIVNNKEDDYVYEDEASPPYPQSDKQIDKDRLEDTKSYFETQLKMCFKDFETTKKY